MKKSTFDVLNYLLNRCKWKKKTDCWIWTNSCGSHGYGNAYHNGKYILAHRLSYEWFKGSIPVDRQIDHLCVNPRCINPDHLEAVTQLENLRRENVRRALTPCLNGHDIEHRYRQYSGRMVCRVCARESQQRSKNKKIKIENYQKEAH